MSKTINFGIDLGTTNSLIAKFDKGQVEVFKNPMGHKETLPSAVFFRNDRIIVGDKAREFAEKDPKGVGSRFKRKMGTTETLKLSSGSRTPVELSAFVLKELKDFVHTGETVEAAVITIPASFDTVQSNATKEAGLAAGFKQVVLLQEPIAASLAYANKEKGIDLRNSQWIVYDLGGGTFDVALVKIVEGELTVIDHEGDNYLGGSDFDALIVEKLVVPEICRRGVFSSDLLARLKSESSKENKLWYRLLSASEEAKIELSAKSSAELDLGMIDDDEGNSIDLLLTITRSEFEDVIRSAIDGTAEMMKKILTRNSLRPDDIEFILMVGGSTLIPFVRKRIEELMDIKVNTAIDPTNAIVVGAAWFAGTKELTSDNKRSVGTRNTQNLKIRTAYNKNSQETEELFTAKLEGDVNGLFYRIVAEDGSFDSGLKTLSTRISEDLPLREGSYNLFRFSVVDSANNTLDVGFDSIQIAHGRYSIAGQMLPEDISLVIDDWGMNDTRLRRIFSRNSVLPAKGKVTQEVAKTIVKGSDEEISIIVVEGPSERHSSTNKPIGVLRLSGVQLSRDLIRGTEIDLTLEISESRELTVSAYLNGTGQEFAQVFQGSAREVVPRLLATDVINLEKTIQGEIEEAEEIGNAETAQNLQGLLSQVRGLYRNCDALNDDDITDDRFRLEDHKRAIAQNVFELTSSKRLDAARNEYSSLKSDTADLVSDSGNDREKHLFREIVAREQIFLNSSNPERIEAAISEIRSLRFVILMRKPDFLIAMFKHLVQSSPSMNDQFQAKQLVDTGKLHIQTEDWDNLRNVTDRLWDLMPDDARESDDMRFYYTGIV
mgnify:CR=1 FL=1